MTASVEKNANGDEIWSVAARTEEKGVIVAISTPYLDHLQANRLAEAIIKVNRFAG